MNVHTKKRLSPKERQERDILTTALERYEICSLVCDEIYKDAVDDIRFSTGDQWDANSIKDRSDRPCLVENRIEGMVHRITNDLKQNMPMIKVIPRDDVTDPNTAEVINGILRYIQYNSDSETAWDTAVSHQVRGGIGYYRVCTDYTDEESFDQEILVKRIQDLRSVKFPIHLSTEIDFRDAPYCFVETEMSKEDFEDEYPDADPDEFQSDMFNGWVTEDKVRVCEYFVVEKKPYTVYKLSDGTITKEKPAEQEIIEGEVLIDQPTVVDTREAYKRVIKWYKITASKILDEGIFPGPWLPIIPVVGDEISFDNKRKFISITRNAKDPQRMLNYWRSAEAERIALAPKPKWVMYEGQDEGFEHEWLDAHKSNNPVLHVKILSENGTALPLPQRQQPNAMDTAIVNAAREAVDAIKACTGIYDASLGNKGPESSGRAIIARQREGDAANYHFADNLAKSLKHCCRVIIDLIPEVYDNERIVRILGEDMKEKVVKVNTDYATEDGKIYDLTAGKYDVMVQTGPSYLSQRQENADSIARLSERDPVLIASLRDLLLKYMDLPAEVVERARKTIDPRLLEESKDPNQQQAQQAMLQLQQSQQMIQQLDQVIQKMQAENEQLKTQIATKVMDNQTKLQIADLGAKVDILVAQINAGMQEKKMAHEVGIEAMKHSHGIHRGDIESMRSVQTTQTQEPSL